jgi:hypothetical protein
MDHRAQNRGALSNLLVSRYYLESLVWRRPWHQACFLKRCESVQDRRASCYQVHDKIGPLLSFILPNSTVDTKISLYTLDCFLQLRVHSPCVFSARDQFSISTFMSSDDRVWRPPSGQRRRADSHGDISPLSSGTSSPSSSSDTSSFLDSDEDVDMVSDSESPPTPPRSSSAAYRTRRSPTSDADMFFSCDETSGDEWVPWK